MENPNILDEFDDILNTDYKPIEKEEDKIVEKNVKKVVEKEEKRNKLDIQKNISDLQGNISSILDQLDTPIEDMFPSVDLLPGIDLNPVIYDYNRDIEIIKIDSKETLECLANLYLNEDMMKNKNIYNIIKVDANLLSKLNFSIECAQKALINCMNQLDSGVSDPLMYQSVAMFQKEMRETIKSTYDLQKKMKDFYKSLSDEIKAQALNSGPEQTEESKSSENLTIIGDPRKLNELIERYKTDHTLLEKTPEKDKKDKK